ncbi:hypothetical protein M2324_003436 [Rhodovulum sulfidophilum]|nr:hypothetical protein [Rhodovulum sulfidophilum]
MKSSVAFERRADRPRAGNFVGRSLMLRKSSSLFWRAFRHRTGKARGQWMAQWIARAADQQVSVGDAHMQRPVPVAFRALAGRCG